MPHQFLESTIAPSEGYNRKKKAGVQRLSSAAAGHQAVALPSLNINCGNHSS
jgi:hypothetical protein